jgi:hypothetical protein
MFSLILYIVLYIFNVFNNIDLDSVCPFETIVLNIPNCDSNNDSYTHTYIFNKIPNAVNGLLIENSTSTGLIIPNNDYIGYIVPLGDDNLPIADLNNSTFNQEKTSCNTNSGCRSINLYNVLSSEQKQTIGLYSNPLPTCNTKTCINNSCKCSGISCTCDLNGTNCTIYNPTTATYNATAYTIN